MAHCSRPENSACSLASLDARSYHHPGVVGGYRGRYTLIRFLDFSSPPSFFSISYALYILAPFILPHPLLVVELDSPLGFVGSFRFLRASSFILQSVDAFYSEHNVRLFAGNFNPAFPLVFL